jgi:hypothetical protein
MGAYESTTVRVVDTTPPTVSIMVPTDGTVVSGVVWFGAGAGDVGGSGISRVEFRADGNLFYTAWGGYMYIADWDSSGAAPGPHVIEVTAFDVAGNSASASITVVTLDTVAPKVSIASPEESAVVSGSVVIEAAATDDSSDVVMVAFAVDGSAVTTDSTAPFSAVWNAADAAVGNHTITATAYDGAGNSAVATRSVVVTAAPPAPTPAASPPPAPTYQLVYRFRNLKLGNHLLTPDSGSLSAAQNKAYVNEGVAYTINVATNTDPVHRFQNKKGGFYVYTADPSEVASIRAKLSGTWTYQGTVFDVSRVTGIPVWRFRNKAGGFYLYTADPVEAAGIPKTWVKEGISYYIAP